MDSLLTAAVARLRGDADQLIVAASQPGPPSRRAAPDRTPPHRTEKDRTAAGGPAGGSAAGAGPEDSGRLVEAMIHRYDLVTAATRLFLEHATYSESVTLQRCARLLAGELAALAGKPPRDIVAGLRSLVVEFCRNELRDDMTMLVLRAGEPPDR